MRTKTIHHRFKIGDKVMAVKLCPSLWGMLERHDISRKKVSDGVVYKITKIARLPIRILNATETLCVYEVEPSGYFFEDSELELLDNGDI